MTEDFDRYLARALGPDEREADRRFVARVQAQIVLQERLASERRALFAGLMTQLVALMAVAAAAWIVLSAAPIAGLFAELPAVGLALLLAAFALIVVMFSRTSRSALRSSLTS
jgi:hypothetical protein